MDQSLVLPWVIHLHKFEIQTGTQSFDFIVKYKFIPICIPRRPCRVSRMRVRLLCKDREGMECIISLN